jgi:putative redox protein
MAELKPVNVTVKHEGVNYRTEIKAGAHSIFADEPVDLGGMDFAPSPHQFLLAALGSCTAITLKMYAGRKEWPLESVSIDVTLNREVVNGIQRSGFNLDIGLSGPLTEEQIARLMEIALKCPVHKTLLSEIHIDAKHKPGG